MVRYRTPSFSADSSLRRAWNSTHRRHGLCPDRTEDYQLLSVRKPTPTVAGHHSATSSAPGISSDAGGGVRRKCSTPARASPLPLLASTPPRTMASTEAERGHSPQGGHGGALPKLGTPPSYVLRAVHTVVTLGRIILPNLKQEPPETTGSGEKLRFFIYFYYLI